MVCRDFRREVAKPPARCKCVPSILIRALPHVSCTAPPAVIFWKPFSIPLAPMMPPFWCSVIVGLDLSCGLMKYKPSGMGPPSASFSL